MSLSVTLKLAARLSVYLLIASCTQATFEKYGCACASRTYTTEEIARYRAGAAKNDLQALAQMEEYHRWRGSEHPENSAESKLEEEKERSYRIRRLTLNDPSALEDEIDALVVGATYWAETDTKDRERALLEAREYTTRLRKEIWQTDVWDPNRRKMRTTEYIERELDYVRQLGRSYHMNRSMHEKRVKDLQKRLDR